METPDFGRALRALHAPAPASVGDSLAGLAEILGIVDVVIYLADFEQVVLTPVPTRGVHVDLPVAEPVDGSQAGTAFRTVSLVREPRPEGWRVWVPVLEGPDCTGALALTVGPDFDDEIGARCEELGMLAGCAIALAARSTDLYNLVRRRKAMSLPASLQWDLLPPLHLEAPGLSSTGGLEPAYDVGGDSFDHALNGDNLDLLILDAMGHGLASSVTSGLAVGTYRHDRREGQTLAAMHERLDEVIAGRFAGETFVTGQLARLELRSGHLSWINAGHPSPLLVRGGRVVGTLRCRPSLPWGLGGGLEEQATEVLEPGDAVLFYTDGITEGRAPDGTPFGETRLVDLVEQSTRHVRSWQAAVRSMIAAIVAYQDRRLRDDATLLLVVWEGPAA